jgi:dephospho-CoA kinase
MLVVGLSGKIASGKTTAAGYLQQKCGFVNLSTRKLLSDLLYSQHREVTRENLQNLGRDLVESVGAGGFIAAMLAYVQPAKYVIDAVRYPEAVDYLRERFSNDYIHLHISADDLIRWKRMNLKDDLRNLANRDVFENAETEGGNLDLERMADYVLTNNGDVSKFLTEIDKLGIFD